MTTYDIHIPHGTNVPEQELLDDLRSVAELQGASWLTEQEYAKLGRFSPSTIRNRFGSWQQALRKIGLDPTDKRYKKHLFCPSTEALLDDIRAVAERLGQPTVTCEEYDKHGKYGRMSARNKFGGWAQVLKAAGLKATGYHTSGVSDEQLLQAICEAWDKLGRQPDTGDVRNGEMGYGLTTYLNRFGSWRNTILALVEYVNTKSNGKVETSGKNPVAHTTSRTPSKQLRERIFVRDNYTCQCCGANRATQPQVELVIDHIEPYSRGGETVADNLQVLCRSCNSKKGNKLSRMS